MKKLIYSILFAALLFSSIGPIWGQCGPGGCPLPSSPSVRSPQKPLFPNLPRLPNSPRNPGNVLGTIREQIEKASVIVESEYGQGMAKGSGTLVKFDSTEKSVVCVFTVSHVVASRQNVKIVHKNFGVIPCSIVKINTIEDWAVLEPENYNEELYEYALSPIFKEDTPQQTGKFEGGETVYLAGFDGSAILRVVSASFVRYNIVSGSSSHNWMVIDHPSRHGDSGGGIIYNGPEGLRLAGMIWGTDPSTTIGTWSSAATVQVRDLTCFRRFFNRRNPPEARPVPPYGGDNPTPPIEKPAPPKEDSPKAEPPKEAPKEQPRVEPSVPGKSLGELVYEFLKPTLLVILGYTAFLITFTVIQLYKHLWR